MRRAPASRTHRARTPRITRPEIVHRVDTFLQDHVGEPIHLSQLCHVTGVSERSLRNACHAVCGTSPKRYLILRRMEAARHALATARPGEATVTRIAADHGFYELGRFAATYSSLFGERPSDTLRRHADPPAPGARPAGWQDPPSSPP